MKKKLCANQKLPYQKPGLVHYGSVRELTKAGPSGNQEAGDPSLCVPNANPHDNGCDNG